VNLPDSLQNFSFGYFFNQSLENVNLLTACRTLALDISSTFGERAALAQKLETVAPTRLKLKWFSKENFEM